MNILVHEIRYEESAKAWLHCLRHATMIPDVFHNPSDRWIPQSIATKALSEFNDSGFNLLLELFYKQGGDLQISVSVKGQSKPLLEANFTTLWDKSNRISISPLVYSVGQEEFAVFAIRLVQFITENHKNDRKK